MLICTTERLALRRLNADDAPFILELVNDDDWLRFIGDKGVRTRDDARSYIANGPLQMYEQHGFGLYLVERLSDSGPIGICGLIKRPGLDSPDVGFAYLPAFRGLGYGFEACDAVVKHAVTIVADEKLLAITSPDNSRSVQLLQRVGFVFDGMVTLPGAADSVRQFSLSLAQFR